MQPLALSGYSEPYPERSRVVRNYRRLDRKALNSVLGRRGL